jgi:hypothetical protein
LNHRAVGELIDIVAQRMAAATESEAAPALCLGAIMPLYFFHTRNGGEFDDDQGTYFADDTAARGGAIIAAGEVLKDLGADFWAGEDWSLRVLSETGRIVCELLLTAKPRV